MRRNIFQLMNSILKAEYDDSELKEYNQYTLNRFFSMEDSLLPLVEYLNRFSIFKLDKRLQYLVTFSLLSGYSKYINILKKEKISRPDYVDKFEERVRKYLKLSKNDFKVFYSNFLKEIEYYIMKFGFEDKQKLRRYYVEEDTTEKRNNKKRRLNDLF